MCRHRARPRYGTHSSYSRFRPSTIRKALFLFLPLLFLLHHHPLTCVFLFFFLQTGLLLSNYKRWKEMRLPIRFTVSSPRPTAALRLQRKLLPERARAVSTIWIFVVGFVSFFSASTLEAAAAISVKITAVESRDIVKRQHPACWRS